MSLSAKLSRISFGVLLLNVVLVVAVAALRPAFATPRPDDPAVDPLVPLKPEVVVPSEVTPLAPLTPSTPTNTNPSLDLPTAPSVPSLATPADAAPPNKMVLDEIRKVIQESHGQLDVPPLTYPSIAESAGPSSARQTAEQLSHRMKSIASITQSAQALLKEAQYLQANGRTNEAQSLLEHVQSLKSIVLKLANEQ